MARLQTMSAIRGHTFHSLAFVCLLFSYQLGALLLFYRFMYFAGGR